MSISFRDYIEKGIKYEFIKGHPFVFKDGKSAGLFVDSNHMRGNYIVMVEDRFKKGIYDLFGNEIIPCNYLDLTICNNGLFIAWNDQYLYGVLDKNNDTVIPFEYKWLHICKNGLIMAQNQEDLYGILNQENQEIIPFKYKSLEICENGLIMAQNQGAYMEY